MLLQTSQRQRGECGTFSGGRKTFRGVCGKLSGGHKSFREVCGKLSGGHKTFRGLCGAFSGVPETSAECAAHFRGSRKSARSVRQTYKTFVFRFALLSACITLDKLGGASDEQT